MAVRDYHAEYRKICQSISRDVLRMAAIGGMPDSYWLTDKRIRRACRWLRWTPEKARSWARAWFLKSGRRRNPPIGGIGGVL